MSNLRMFGIGQDELAKHYGPDSLNFKACGGAMGLAVSIMSDVQEMIERGRLDEARQYLNRAKMVLLEQMKRDRGE